jgi:monoterpene epsilon-lactone hydrolase
MVSAQAERVKAGLAAFAATLAAGPELDEMRRSFQAFSGLGTVPDGVSWTEVDAGGVPAIWAEPDDGSGDAVILYVHGGGYVIGSADAYRGVTGHLARAAGCRVLNVDYRLAPEHPHPAAVEDSTAAYRWLLEQGVAPTNVAIAGDSAGGGLTVATLLAIRDAGLPQPAAAVPISPWVDMEATGATMTSNAGKDVLIQEGLIKGLADAFLQGSDPRQPLAAPLHADLTGLAPLYIQVGGDETLLDDARRLAERATAAGVDTRLEVFPEMQHVFQIAAGALPEADDAWRKVADYLRPRLGLV